MTRQQALALAKKRWGKEGWVSENKNAPDKETREIIRKELDTHQERKPKEPKPTPEQLKYYADMKQWKEELQQIRSKLLRHRWECGSIYHLPGLGRGLSIQGSGDTLEEMCKAARLINAES